MINRGYYTAARRYEFNFRVVKTIFYKRAHVQQVSKIFFFVITKIHICEPLCNFLFIVIDKSIFAQTTV